MPIQNAAMEMVRLTRQQKTATGQLLGKPSFVMYASRQNRSVLPDVIHKTGAGHAPHGASPQKHYGKQFCGLGEDINLLVKPWSNRQIFLAQKGRVEQFGFVPRPAICQNGYNFMARSKLARGADGCRHINAR